MSDGNQQPVLLAYGLCAIAGAGFCFNAIVLVWFTVRSSNVYSVGSLHWRTVEWISRLITVTYICDGAALTALVLHRDLDSRTLCTIGGHVLLCSLQISLWLLAILAVLFACTTHRHEHTLNKRRHIVGVASAVFMAVVISAMFSFLPLVRTELLNNNADDSYYRCMPLRRPHTQSGPYWMLVVASMWSALVTTVVALVVAFVKLSRSDLSSLDTKVLTRRTFLVISINCALWTATVVVASVGYISAEYWLDREQSEWVLGYIISGIILLYPGLTLTLANCRQTEIPSSSSSSSPPAKVWYDTPKYLHSLRRDDDVPTKGDGVYRYVITWRDTAGRYVTGTMKVFQGNAQYRWRNEVAAMKKLGQSKHRNITQYMWHASHNDYNASIRAFTNDVMPHDASVICRRHYSSGTLDRFMDTSVSQLTEVTLHKLTLDIASGLAHIHQHNIVHNALSTHTIMLASESGKSTLYAVISDFDNSYDVSRETAFSHESGMPLLAGSTDLFTISQLTERQSRLGTVFATDIRSFGKVVLQMLLKISEYNGCDNRRPAQGPQHHAPNHQQKQHEPQQQQQQQQQHGKGEREMVHRSYTLATPHVRAHSMSECNCSQAVTEIRVHGDEWNGVQVALPPRNVQQSMPNVSSFPESISLDCGCSDADTLADDNRQSLKKLEIKSTCAHMVKEHPHVRKNAASNEELERRCSEQTTNRNDVCDKDDMEYEECKREQNSDYVDDACSTSVASLASFETIYEDESYVGTTNEVCNTSDKRRARPHVRRATPIGMTGKQWMSGSVDGSLHSTDSGIGCSELAYQCTSYKDFSNTPGNRGTIYSTNSPSMSECESYSALSDFFDRTVQSPADFDIRLWDGRSKHPAFVMDSNCRYTQTTPTVDIHVRNKSEHRKRHLDHMSSLDVVRNNHEFMDVNREHWHPSKWLTKDEMNPSPSCDEISIECTGPPNPHFRQPRRSLNVPSLGIAAVACKRAEGCSCWLQSDANSARCTPREPCNCNAVKRVGDLSLSRASVCSSVMSIINDSRLILSASDISELHDTDSKTESVSESTPTINISSYQIKNRERSRNDGDSSNRVDDHLELYERSEMISEVDGLSRKHTNEQSASSMMCLENIFGDEITTKHLGYTAGQLLPLLSDCWKDTPSLSARDIIARLAHLLPAETIL